jgi:hypothetical protein
MNLHDRDREESVGLIKAALAGRGQPLGLRKYSEDQPRDENGQWTDSGGGSAGGADKQPVSMREAEAPHFVLSFARENPSIAERKAALKSRPDEKLRTALRLTEGKHDASTKLFRELIADELKSRGAK